MAFKDLFTGPTQLCAVLLQAPLNGHIIIQLFSTKAGSIARTSLLLLWCSEMATLCRSKRGCERRRLLEQRPAVKRAFGVSLNSNAVIVIHRTGPRGIVPVPGIVVAVLWRSFQLLLRYSGAITAQVGVVLQGLPG
jgi:hypothetical protein